VQFSLDRPGLLFLPNDVCACEKNVSAAVRVTAADAFPRPSATV
jgi:hypothetical protein